MSSERWHSWSIAAAPEVQVPISRDIGPVLQRVHDRLPDTGGVIAVRSPRGVFLETEVVITKPNVAIVFGPTTTVDITRISGDGTANVHNTVNTIAGFRWSGEGGRVIGGRWIGSNTSAEGHQVTTVLLQSGADRFTAAGMEISGLYTGIWPGGGISDLLLEDLSIDDCSHNLLLGYSVGAATDPQVTRAVVRGVRSKNSTNDGLKAQSFVDGLVIEGGIYGPGNTRDDIDLFVGGRSVVVNGVICDGAGQRNLDAKSGSDTGANGGYNDRLIVTGCQFLNSLDRAVAIKRDSADVGEIANRPLDHVIFSNNLIRDAADRGLELSADYISVHGNHVENTGDRGMNFLTCRHGSIVGNLVRRCATSEGNIGINFGIVAAGYPVCTGLLIAHNTVIGSGVASGQIVGVDAGTVDMDNCIFLGNRSVDHDNSDWSIDAAMTGLTMRDNVNYVNHRRFVTASIATGTAVAHGLDVTPIAAVATPLTSGPSAVTCPVSSFDATNIDIEFAGGGSHTFAVEAWGEYAV